LPVVVGLSPLPPTAPPPCSPSKTRAALAGEVTPPWLLGDRVQPCGASGVEVLARTCQQPGDGGATRPRTRGGLCASPFCSRRASVAAACGALSRSTEGCGSSEASVSSPTTGGHATAATEHRTPRLGAVGIRAALGIADHRNRLGGIRQCAAAKGGLQAPWGAGPWWCPGAWPDTTLEATQGQIDGFFSQLPYKCHQNRVVSVGD